MYCKHPEEACCNMTFYGGKIYCDNINGFCHLHDEFPPYTNADKIRDMNNEELAKFLCEITDCGSCRWASWTGCLVREWLKEPCEI